MSSFVGRMLFVVKTLICSGSIDEGRGLIQLIRETMFMNNYLPRSSISITITPKFYKPINKYECVKESATYKVVTTN